MYINIILLKNVIIIIFTNNMITLIVYSIYYIDSIILYVFIAASFLKKHLMYTGWTKVLDHLKNQIFDQNSWF